jgi:hypothetical protein
VGSVVDRATLGQAFSENFGFHFHSFIPLIIYVFLFIYLFIYLTAIGLYPCGSSTAIEHNRQVTHITRINQTFKQQHSTQNTTIKDTTTANTEKIQTTTTNTATSLHFTSLHSTSTQFILLLLYFNYFRPNIP